DLFDFCQRVDLKKLNRRCLETLIKCGAMDELGENRATLSASLSTAVQVAEQALQNQNSGQNDLFGLTDNTQQDSVNDWQQRAEWEDKARLNYEKETLGFYLSGHPIDAYAEELKRFTSYTIAKLDGEKKQTVVIAGLLVGVRTVKTRRGDLMGIITLDDATGKLDITLFSDLFAEIREQLQKDQLFIVTGEVSVDDFSGGLRMTATEILDISSARQRFGKRLVLSMKSNGSDALKLQNLYDILAAHREGQCPVRIHYQLNGIRAYVDFSSDWRICPSDELLSGLDQLSGFDGIRVEY
ncbi:MAG: OB-fold nucleic acid binding domain-containing protein, partial [Gammaproteobacteria bacterium]|nr:OB-fold nucleic acid binding domain-containing protein [Gammaproteobacteria bacterium]